MNFFEARERFGWHQAWRWERVVAGTYYVSDGVIMLAQPLSEPCPDTSFGVGPGRQGMLRALERGELAKPTNAIWRVFPKPRFDLTTPGETKTLPFELPDVKGARDFAPEYVLALIHNLPGLSWTHTQRPGCIAIAFGDGWGLLAGRDDVRHPWDERP